MTEERHASLPDDCTRRSLGEIAVIWGVAIMTVGILFDQLVLPSSSPAKRTLQVASDYTVQGPAHVTRFDVMYAHLEYTKVETFVGSPEACSIIGNSGTEVLVAGKLSEPLASANLVLADGTEVTADSQALGDPNNPVARFRFELREAHQGLWRYTLTNLLGEKICSEPLLLIVVPQAPTKSWPSWPDEPTPEARPEVTVT